jgi:hypothetical protein
MTKYKEFVEEYKVNYKFSDNKKYFSYPMFPIKKNTYIYESNNIYYTTEPTEKNEALPITLPTILPTTLHTNYPTYNNSNIENSITTVKSENNDANTIFIICFTTIFISLCLFMSYFYKYYLKYKKNKKKLKQDKLDLEFGISYIEDI